MSPKTKHPGHLNILQTMRNGRVTFRLVTNDSSMAEFFDEWAYKLAETHKFRSVKLYCYAVARFLNYFYELMHLYGEFTPSDLRNALDNYESYLAFGPKSNDEKTASVARALGSQGISANSIGVHFAAVNNFIDASERLRIAVEQLEQLEYISDASNVVMPMSIERYLGAPQKIRQAIRSKSWLAGCLYGGVKKIKVKGLIAKGKTSIVAFTDMDGGDDLVFPINRCAELIENAPSLRDKVLWSFIAASGCRVSEALTLMIDDISISVDGNTANKVYIVDPATRKEILIRYMAQEQIEKLAHKGRAMPDTYLIEPFASTFWESLDLYIAEVLEHELASHRQRRHRFLFRNLKNGDPIPSSYQAVWERFTLAINKIGLDGYGFHSLRHMYGYYLVNHCPNPNNPNLFGFDLKTVQMFMGHKNIESTKRYARQDARLLEAAMSTANMFRMRHDSFSVTSARIAFLENQINLLKKTIGFEGGL